MSWGREEVKKLVAFLFSLQWPAAGSDLKDRSRALDNKEGEAFPLTWLDNSRHTVTAPKATVVSNPLRHLSYNRSVRSYFLTKMREGLREGG